MFTIISSPDYPPLDIYRKLYKRFQSKDKEFLTDLNFDNVENILDIGAGDAGLLNEIKKLIGKKQKIDYTYLDRNKEWFEEIANSLWSTFCIKVLINHSLAEEFFTKIKEKFDLILAKQNVNYWFDSNVAEQIYDHLRVDGIFRFNTFIKWPTIRAKTYNINGIDYFEHNSIQGNLINHQQQCQIGKDVYIHTTSFKYIKGKEFKEILVEAGFKVELKITGNSALYTCKKK